MQARSRFITACASYAGAFTLYNIFIPLQIAYGIQAIINHHFGLVDSYAWHVLFLALGYCVLWTLGDLTSSSSGVIAAGWVQQEIFSNFLQKDYDFYTDAHFGSLGAEATRLREAVIEYRQLTMLAIPKQCVIVVAGVIVIGIHSLLLAATTVALMAVVLSFTIASSAFRLRYRRAVSEASSALAGVIGDALSHGATVKSFASTEHEVALLEQPLATWRQAQYRTWVTSIPANGGRMLLAAVATAVLLVLPSHLYQQHHISIAIVALVQLYVIKLITATQDISEIIKVYEGIMSAAHKSLQTMLIKPTIVDRTHPRRLPKRSLDITFSDVSFHYGDAKAGDTAVTHFDLHIRAGEKIGLVGYSGSGKTTLTKLLLRFADVSEGSIALGGIDLRELAQDDLRQHIAYVPQEPLLFHRSIADNILYAKPHASRGAMLRAAKMAYVDEFTHDLPRGYATLVGERGVKLSGGQRQRVAIARALLKGAPILILDEATSALDSRSEKLIQQALEKLMHGRTALVIAHRLSTIQRMDRIIVMDKGRIVQQGTHQELLADAKGIYAKLWAHQSGGYLALPEKEEG